MQNIADTLMTQDIFDKSAHVKKLLADDFIEGAGLVLVPQANTSRLLVHWQTQEKNARPIEIDRFYNYAHASWFEAATKHPQGIWLTPYDELVVGHKVIRFAIPLFLKAVHESGHRYLAALFTWNCCRKIRSSS